MDKDLYLGYTTWIGEVGLGHWERSGLSGDGEEVIGVVSGCEITPTHDPHHHHQCIMPCTDPSTARLARNPILTPPNLGPSALLVHLDRRLIP